MARIEAPLDDILDPRFDPKMNVAQRIHLGMTLASYVQKEPKKSGMNYSFVSHDAVTSLIRTVCQQVGLIFYPVADTADFKVNGNRVDLKLSVRFENIHDREDFIDVLGIGFGIDQGDKGPGKATSYAVKYALLKAFGLETGDDPDQDQDVTHRTSTMQRADELEKQLLMTKNETELFSIMRDPTTEAIFQALARDSMAERRRLGSVVSQHAKAIGADMTKLKEEGESAPA